MEYTSVIVSKNENMGIITLNRPEFNNTFNVPLAEKLEEETLKYAKKLADKSPLALQLGKKSFYKMEDLDYEKALDLTNNHFASLCTTEDANEGVHAFLNKRKPVWKNK